MQKSNNKNLHLTFPELPQYSATWAPILWEPIMLSGEKLTAIIAAIGNDGEILVEPILRQDILKILYPNKHSDAISLINWVCDTCKNHLSKGGNFSDWASPFSGFSVGETHLISSQNIQSVIRQAIPLCSSLSDLGTVAHSETTKTTEMSNDRWRNSIREEVIRRLPRLDQSFNRQFKIVAGARQTTIDFVGQKTASNFSRLISNQLSRCVRDSKAQILDLAALRDDISLFTGDERYQLMVWRPDEAQKDTLSEQQKRLIEEAFLELEGEGDRFELKVVSHFNSISAAESICKLEIAA